MGQPTISQYTISDFLEWNASGQLVIAPKFQRRDVWIQKAKSYLIDTILRCMSIPPLFIRLRIDPLTKRVVREVVDGQQRLRSVLGFIAGEFPVLEAHNPDFAGMYYADLPDKKQREFLGYHFLVNMLQEVSDSEVLSIFARLNTYTVKLNAQELRNSAYFGVFKQTVYKVAHKYYNFWRNNNILSDQKIARMGDAELVSELMATMVKGICQTKSSDLKWFYENYDDKFNHAKKYMKEFEETINIIGYIFGNKIKSTPFRRLPLFYTLFCCIYDAKFGLTGSQRSRLPFTSRQIKKIARRLEKLSEIIKRKEIPTKYVQFVDDTRLSTADVGRRKRRHKFIWDNVLARV